MNLISSQFILQNRGIIKENAVNKTAVRLSDFIISNNSKKNISAPTVVQSLLR